MNKLLLLVILSVLLVVDVTAQLVTDLQRKGLKGKVKTLLQDGAMLDGKPGKWKELRRNRSITTLWDKDGYETEFILWSSDGPFMKTVSSYDAKHRIRTEKRYELWKNKSTAPRGFPLDAHGNPITSPRSAPSQTPEPDFETYEFLCKFDDAGNLSEHLVYKVEPSGKTLSERRVYVWDSAGNQKEEQRYYETGKKLTWKFAYKYDAQGNEIEWTRIEGKNKPTSRATYSDYQFDAQGNWISRINREEYLNSIGMLIKTTSITYRQFTYW